MRGATKSRRRSDEAGPPPAPGRRDFRPAALEPAVHCHVGFYADGTPGEVFIDSRKTGTDLESSQGTPRVLLRLALQHGVSPETIRDAVTRDASEEPASILGAVVNSITAKSFAGGV